MDFVSRSSQRPSLWATTCLPFCTVALFPSINKRYSPASSFAVPTLADWLILIVLLTGFANTGTASATTASNTTLRRNELDFMRVTFSIEDRVSRRLPAGGETEIDTRAQGRVAFPERHFLFL